jgi:hypothetical protein
MHLRLATSALSDANWLTGFLGRSVLGLLKLEHNTAAVATALRFIAAAFGHPVDPPEEAKKEIGLGPTPACASRKDIRFALGPRALATGRQFEDDTVVMATAAPRSSRRDSRMIPVTRELWRRRAGLGTGV